jgi:hypothetical protein
MAKALVEAVCRHPAGLSCDVGDAAVYLEMNDWDLESSIEEAIGDLQWEATQQAPVTIVMVYPDTKKKEKPKPADPDPDSETQALIGAHEKVQ